MSQYVPNPRCCTDSRYLCSRCSTAACKAAALVANAQFRGHRRLTVDPDDGLPIPTIDWTLNQSRQTKHPDCGCSKTSHVSNILEETGLPIPKPDWAAWSSERGKTTVTVDQ